MDRQTDRTSTPTGCWQRRVGLSAIFLALAAVPVIAGGAGVAAQEQIDHLVREALGDERRLVVEVANLDSRLKQAPCDSVEPFVPAGARLWGRTTIGIRCADGVQWNVALPIHVRVFGPALVASTTLLAGTPASDGAFRMAEIELSRQSGKVLDDPTLLDGKVLSRAIAAGQPLRASDLRVLQTVTPGDPVHIKLIGNGFEIGAEGVALSGAGEGQTVRVRTDAGKVLSGTTRGRTVEIRM